MVNKQNLYRVYLVRDCVASDCVISCIRFIVRFWAQVRIENT